MEIRNEENLPNSNTDVRQSLDENDRDGQNDGAGGTASWVIRLSGAIFMLFSLCIFFKLIKQPTNALNKIQFMSCINLLHAWAQGCQAQGVLHFQVIHAQLANLGMHNWND
jgi:hypothetical protein